MLRSTFSVFYKKLIFCNPVLSSKFSKDSKHDPPSVEELKEILESCEEKGNPGSLQPYNKKTNFEKNFKKPRRKNLSFQEYKLKNEPLKTLERPDLSMPIVQNNFFKPSPDELKSILDINLKITNNDVPPKTLKKKERVIDTSDAEMRERKNERQRQYLKDIIRKNDEAQKRLSEQAQVLKEKSENQMDLISQKHKNPFRKMKSEQVSKNTSEELVNVLDALDYHRVARNFTVHMTPSTREGFLREKNPSMRLNIFDRTKCKEQEESNETTNIFDVIESCEFRQIEMSLPNNQFEEWIQWTKDKKMWKFPINNEQDSPELNVSFHEHVFPQQYLSGVLPKTGLVGQFMNYVCIGLSQNPHLTVQEKKAHIKWYEEYLSNKTEEIEIALKKSLDDRLHEENLRKKK